MKKAGVSLFPGYRSGHKKVPGKKKEYYSEK
jgi:hypothetical protein